MRIALVLLIALVANTAVGAESCPTDVQARKVLFVHELARLKANDTFAIIESRGQYVQFAGGKELLLDIPNQMLTGDREPKLRALLGSNIYKNTFAGGYSLQATFATPESAAATADAVFQNVYGLAANYPITGVTTESGERSFDCTADPQGGGVTPPQAEKAKREMLGEEAQVVQTKPGGHNRPANATASVKSAMGPIVLWYDPNTWSVRTSLEKSGAEFVLTHKSGNAAAKLIVERMGLTLPAVKRKVMENIKKASSQSQLVAEDRRTVNGVEMMMLHFTAMINDVPAAYLGYYWTGKAGTVQVIA